MFTVYMIFAVYVHCVFDICSPVSMFLYLVGVVGSFFYCVLVIESSAEGSSHQLHTTQEGRKGVHVTHKHFLIGYLVSCVICHVSCINHMFFAMCHVSYAFFVMCHVTGLPIEGGQGETQYYGLWR